MRLGIDVGGTNTDAAILDADLQVVQTAKVPTTSAPEDGIVGAVRAVLEQSSIDPAEITHTMLGTTHCTNAIVQRTGLSRVGVLRLGYPATTAVPPFEGWPQALAAEVHGYSAIVSGGCEHTGRPIQPLDADEIEEHCRRMRGQVDAVAVVGVFSPVVPEVEARVARIVADSLGVPVTCSAQIGAIGLLERENAAILNAALGEVLAGVATGLHRAMSELGVNSPLYIGQNDGTLMNLSYALAHPVFTIGCGPTNSIRGAAHLAASRDALVVDIGGTTSDVGVLVDGFPRESGRAVDIGGIETNFRMPDVLSIGLGGGSIVRFDCDGAMTATSSPALRVGIGPDSVGHAVTQRSQSFGGDVLTATDIVLAAGRAVIPGALPPALDPTSLATAQERMQEMLEEAIDRMKPARGSVDVILVGGGSILAPDRLVGAARVIRPVHGSAANAIGAALADVSGQAEHIAALSRGREAALEAARAEAIERAVQAGADRDTVEITDIEEIPMAYLDDDTVRIRVRAVGALSPG